MNRWLPTLVRARQAREDAASQQVAQQRREVVDAAAAAAALSERLDALEQPASAGAGAFLAAAAIRDAAAGTHSAAVQRIGFAEQRLASGMAFLAEAARSRRTVERLAERIAAAQYASELAAYQRELDEVSAARHARASASGGAM